MAKFQAVYYRAPDGSEPVRRFLARLPAKRRAAIANQVDRFNELDERMPHLPFPHSSQIDGELRELRCHYGSDHYRVLYRRSGSLIVLLHMFAKRTAKVPTREIEVANQRFEDFKARMNAPKRRPPRAAGHDAP